MILEPPAIYDHPYAPLTESIYKAPMADKLCRQTGLKGDYQIIGCQFFIGKHCFILISEHALIPLRRHETAHCNGWKHD